MKRFLGTESSNSVLSLSLCVKCKQWQQLRRREEWKWHGLDFSEWERKERMSSWSKSLGREWTKDGYMRVVAQMSLCVSFVQTLWLLAMFVHASIGSVDVELLLFLFFPLFLSLSLCTRFRLLLLLPLDLNLSTYGHWVAIVNDGSVLVSRCPLCPLSRFVLGYSSLVPWAINFSLSALLSLLVLVVVPVVVVAIFASFILPNVLCTHVCMCANTGEKERPMMEASSMQWL